MKKLLLVSLLTGCSAVTPLTPQERIKIYDAQMALNSQPMFRFTCPSGNCEFEYRDPSKTSVIGVTETSQNDVALQAIKEAGAVLRQVSPWAAGAYAINSVVDGLRNSHQQNTTTITHTQGDTIGNGSRRGDSLGDYANGTGINAGTNIGNTAGDVIDNTHSPTVVDSVRETVQVVNPEVVRLDAPEVVEVRPEVVNPTVVRPEIVRLETQE